MHRLGLEWRVLILPDIALGNSPSLGGMEEIVAVFEGDPRTNASSTNDGLSGRSRASASATLCSPTHDLEVARNHDAFRPVRPIGGICVPGQSLSH